MQIEFERSGGFAGMSLKTAIDTKSLPAEEAKQLRQLVDAADFFNLPPKIAPKTPQPDRFQYQLTVRENDKQHTVEVGEQATPGTLRPLLDRLMTAARE
jgi:hypothetical protein